MGTNDTAGQGTGAGRRDDSGRTTRSGRGNRGAAGIRGRPGPPRAESARGRRRAEMRVWRNGLLASLALHLLFLLSGGRPPIPEMPLAAAGPDADDDRAARGGMQAVNVAVPPARPLVRPQIPLPVDIEMDPVEIDAEPSFDLASLLGDPGPLGPPGQDDGEGEGDGGSADAGRIEVAPPVPRMMIIPPANKNLRGVRFEVWVFVDEEGSVVPDSTRIDPPTKDRGFNRQLAREAAGWMFAPGRRGGRPVAAWFSYMVTM